MYAGLTREQAADLVGVSLRTVGHWETGQARPTYAAFKLLRVLRHGDLIDPRWAGYSLIRGKLVSPENHTFEPSDMAWWALTVRMAHAFRDRVRMERDGKARSGAEPTQRPAPAMTIPPIQEPGGSAASALGLVYSSTSGTGKVDFDQKPLVLSGFDESCGSVKVVPIWCHDETSQTAPGEAQSPATCRPEGSAPSLRRRGRRATQHGCSAGNSQLPAVRSSTGKEASHCEAEGCSSTSGLADNNAHGKARRAKSVVSQGRKKRAVSLRKRAQSKGLPSGLVLTGGAL